VVSFKKIYNIIVFVCGTVVQELRAEKYQSREALVLQLKSCGTTICSRTSKLLALCACVCRTCAHARFGKIAFFFVGMRVQAQVICRMRARLQ
jgi:hypothetical protein